MPDHRVQPGRSASPPYEQLRLFPLPEPTTVVALEVAPAEVAASLSYEQLQLCVVPDRGSIVFAHPMPVALAGANLRFRRGPAGRRRARDRRSARSRLVRSPA